MNLKNHTYYFSKVPKEYNDREDPPSGWEPNYYFRFKIPNMYDEQINFEDTCNRMVPFGFEDLCEMRDTLNKIITEIASSSVGASYNEVS